MILCVDIGNSNIVLGIYQDNELKNTYRMKTSLQETEDGYGMIIHSFLIQNGYTFAHITGIIISSVVPMIDVTFERLSIKYFKIKPIFVGPGIKTGIHIKLDHPKQLGADLLVGAVGVVEKYTLPAIIIDMGTAITVMVVNEKHELLGGMIYPGVKTAFNSLIEKASKLEEARMTKADHIIGRDTATALQSGMVFGTSSMLDGVIRKFKLSYPNAIVVLTGGESKYVVDYLEETCIVDDNLLLDGLHLLYWKNIEKV